MHTAMRHATTDELSDDVLDVMLETIRERRLLLVREKQKVERARASVRSEKLRDRLTKQLAMFEKELAAVDKAIEKVNGRILTIRALRLELNDMTVLGEIADEGT